MVNSRRGNEAAQARGALLLVLVNPLTFEQLLASRKTWNDDKE